MTVTLLLKKTMRWIEPLRDNPLKGLSDADRTLIERIVAERLTYLSPRKLASIAVTCREIEARQLPGVMIEAGCALGGSAILMASLKRSKRPLFVYDVFGMIPPPTDADGADVQKRYATIKEGSAKGLGDDLYYGYEDNLYEIVRQNLAAFDIDEERHHTRLVQGLLQETLVGDQPVALAHVDVDWYEPVKVCLERIVPRLVVGGSLILDDYNDWSGCRKATDEYFRASAREFEMDDSATSMKVTRIRPVA